MIRTLVISILFLIGFSTGSRAQSRLLPHLPDDTSRVNALLANGLTLNYSYPDSALEYVIQANKLSQRLNYRKGLSEALFQEGMIKSGMALYEEAVRALFHSVKIASELQDTILQVKAYNTLGNTYAIQSNYIEALKYYDQALPLAIKSGNRRMQATIHSNIGNLHYYREYETGDNLFTETLKHYSEALRVQEELRDSMGAISTLQNLGLVYSDQGKFNESLQVLQRAYDLALKLNSREDIMHSYSNLGRLYGNMKYYSFAIDYHNRSIQLARDLGNRDMVAYGYGHLAETYAEMGNYYNAWKFQEQYSLLRDSLLNEETTRQMAEMQAKYETEKREKELARLKEENFAKEVEADRNRTLVWLSFGGGGILLLVSSIIGLLLYNRYQIKKKANEQLSIQNEVIAQKNKDITDSINYARKIQRSVITTDAYLQKHLPDHFIMYKPKDIVSGDFYWAFSPGDHEVIVATADCTGHGVPGAFMSVLGASLLNHVVVERKVLHPHLALNLLRENLIKVLNQENSHEELRDGMDIVLCRFNFEKLTLSVAAANNPLWIARGHEMLEVKADRFPVGKHSDGVRSFTLKNIQLYKGDVVYAFTDGYADQFGGPHGKKFKYKELQNLLMLIKDKPMNEQKIILDKRFEEWRNGLEQVDDVTVIGIRV